jgi:hypothetical protein
MTCIYLINKSVRASSLIFMAATLVTTNHMICVQSSIINLDLLFRQLRRVCVLFNVRGSRRKAKGSERPFRSAERPIGGAYVHLELFSIFRP